MALVGFVSLGVDYGRVQMVRTELRRAADAAARYALQGITNGTAVAKAQACATENLVDGTALALQTADIEIGMWANNTFTPGGATPNAVRVTARRTSARGTAVPLLFAKAIGANTCDLVVTTTAYRAPSAPSSYGLVGLNSVAMTGGSKIDSYDSSISAYGGGNVSTSGDVGSNGNVTLSGSGTRVNGDINYGTSSSATVTAPATVSGTSTAVGGSLNYPNPSTPPAGSYANYGSVTVATGNMTMAGGSYYFTGVTITGGTFAFSGPATLYLNGPLTMSGGTIRAYLNQPENLRIIQLSASPISLTGTVDLYADVYAPNSAFTMSGTPELFGRIISKTATLGGGTIHFDSSMPIIGTLNGGGGIAIVK